MISFVFFFFFILILIFIMVPVCRNIIRFWMSGAWDVIRGPVG